MSIWVGYESSMGRVTAAPGPGMSRVLVKLRSDTLVYGSGTSRIRAGYVSGTGRI